MRSTLAAAVLTALTIPAVAQTAPPASSPDAPTPATAAPAREFTSRLDQLLAYMKNGGDYDALFAPSFRAWIDEAKLDAVIAQVTQVAGPVQRIAAVRAVGPHAGVVTMAAEGAEVTLQVAVDPATPHQIVALLVTGVSAPEASLSAVDAAMAQLPGTTGLLVARLDATGPVPIVGRNAGQAFAIGSEFKLVILATLVRDIAAGKRTWGDLVTLDGVERPAGAWSKAPAGTKVSLRDLAAKMISVSDNSATDILLNLAGRAQVEAMMPVVGITDPARSRPFLSTAELFKLKAFPALADRYLELDEKGRRAMLAGEIARTPLNTIPPTLFTDGKPVRIDRLEWFFSPSDVVRLLDWIRRTSEGGPAADVRAILAINPALPPAAAGAWAYAGYKGGSEPGVMAMSWLLQAKDGRWFAVSGSWNDPAKEVDQARFVSLMQRAVELAAKP